MKKLTAKTFFNFLVGLVVSVLFLAGCTTTIPIQVERPPNLDTTGIRRLAVMPFEAANSNYQQIAQYATDTAAARMQAMNHFTMVNSSEIQRLRSSNQNIENYVDALFSGRIINVTSSQKTETSQYRNSSGGISTQTTYITTASVDFSYSFTRARDGSLIGPVNKRGSKTASSQDGYPAASSLYTTIVEEQLNNLHQDVLPHTVTVQRTMATEKTVKDKALKDQMKTSLAEVKAGNYNAALETYVQLYTNYKSVAAAENASILYEATGDTKGGADFMQKVVQETGNPTARDILARLNKVLADQAAAADAGERLTAAESQSDKATAYASEEIRKVLPENAKVWFVNQASQDSTVEAVVDNLTADFIRRGISTVDRQSRELIEAEQQLQMSGTVTEADYVSIGNAMGANTIVTVSISGSGAVRRLQVRVVDVETGTPKMQSDTSDNWNL